MPPHILLALFLGTIYGTVFHVWRGKTLRDFLIYLLSGIIGVLLGQVLGEGLSLTNLTIGQFYIIEASVLSILCLILIHWLKGVRPTR